MKGESYLLRLRHMLDAIHDIALLTEKQFGFDLQSDRINQLALERSFEILSEASRHLPEDLKARHANIPWSKVAGIGNVIRHGYELVDLTVLLRIAREDLPALERVCLVELDGTDQPPPPRA